MKYYALNGAPRETNSPRIDEQSVFSGIDDALSIDSNICLGAHGYFPQSFTLLLLRICFEHVWKLKK